MLMSNWNSKDNTPRCRSTGVKTVYRSDWEIKLRRQEFRFRGFLGLAKGVCCERAPVSISEEQVF